MAVFDPPDGSADPRPRCVGHCCRGFSLEHPLSVVQAEYERWRADPESATLIPDISTIAPMLIPLGVFRRQELFTCKHLGADGNCGIYETRPRMCRDFPGPKPCPYRNCGSHGAQSRLKRAWNWVRE
ncbi:MAG: YkgJ family cysteine cluster protein [Bdellovibrionota bacterium]